MSGNTLVNALQFLNPQEITRLRRRSDLVGALLVLHAWALIAAAMALFVAWPNVLTFLVGVAVVGGRQLGLAILMHEAAHGLLFRTRALNEWVGQWLCGHPIAADMLAYRPYHFAHHRRTQQPDDPDLVLSAPFPVTGDSLRRKFLRDLVGRTAYQQRRAQLVQAFGPAGLSWPERGRRLRRELLGPVVTNVVLLAVLVLIGRAYLYPLLWLVPLATSYQLVTRVRNIAEHAMVPDHDDPLRNTRTTRAGLLARVLMAPYWVNYHLEHHLFLFVPCWRLPLAHRMLLAKGYGERMERQPGYTAVLQLAASAAARS